MAPNFSFATKFIHPLLFSWISLSIFHTERIFSEFSRYILSEKNAISFVIVYEIPFFQLLGQDDNKESQISFNSLPFKGANENVNGNETNSSGWELIDFY